MPVAGEPPIWSLNFLLFLLHYCLFFCFITFLFFFLFASLPVLAVDSQAGSDACPHMNVKLKAGQVDFW